MEDSHVSRAPLDSPSVEEAHPNPKETQAAQLSGVVGGGERAAAIVGIAATGATASSSSADNGNAVQEGNAYNGNSFGTPAEASSSTAPAPDLAPDPAPAPANGVPGAPNGNAVANGKNGHFPFAPEVVIGVPSAKFAPPTRRGCPVQQNSNTGQGINQGLPGGNAHADSNGPSSPGVGADASSGITIAVY